MKKISKGLVIILTMIMLVLNFGGCAKKSGDEAMKVSILFSDNAGSPYNANWALIKEVEKLKNVKLDVQVVPASDYAAKKSIVMQSGEIPDLLTNTWANQVHQYAQQGLLLPVSDYIDKMPNLKKYLEYIDDEAAIDDICEADGKFYVLPAFEKHPVGTNTFAIRKDIFDQNNIKVPETYDELFDALVELKKIYPDSLGIGDLYNGKLLMSFVASSFGTKGGYSLPFGYSYNYDTKEWYFAPTSEQYKTLLGYMNKLYNAGCIDPEGFTQDSALFKQKVLTNKYFVVPVFGYGSCVDYNKELKEAGFENADFELIYPMAGPEGIRKGKPTSKYGGGLAISSTVAKRKDFDKFLEFIDWMYYSEEAAILTTAGIEGVTYTKSGDEYIFNEDIITVANKNGTKSLSKDFGVGINGIKTLTDYKPESVERSLVEEKELEFKQNMIDQNWVDKDDPGLKFSEEQNEKVQLLYTGLNDYTESMIVKFIYGEESFDNWQNFVDKCKQLGSDELIEIVRKTWSQQNQ